MNPIAFFRHVTTDHAGRTLAEIQSWDHGRLERTHDYIQWLFPLAEPSAVNPLGPLVDTETLRAFRSDARLRDALERSLMTMLDFYGLTCDQSADGVAITRSALFNQRAAVWLTPYNHNYLRLTRILKSLTLLGLEQHAQALFRSLDEIYQQHSDVIGTATYAYWTGTQR